MVKDKLNLKSLKEQILEVLEDDGRSISSIIKELEKNGTKIHRLVVTGYLEALVDLNILKEKEIKPSKVFSIASSKEKSIYDITGSFFADHPESADVCLFVLNRLFKRPILKWELDRCNVGRPNTADRILGDQRKDALDMLERLGIIIPKNMPAYVETKTYTSEYIELLTNLVMQKYNISQYVADKKTQLKIDSI